jgi:hypothetical protein
MMGHLAVTVSKSLHFYMVAKSHVEPLHVGALAVSWCIVIFVHVDTLISIGYFVSVWSRMDRISKQ